MKEERRDGGEREGREKGEADGSKRELRRRKAKDGVQGKREMTGRM